MTRLLRNYFRRNRQKRMVRPWALSAPILVLLIAVPLVEPLRHPDRDLRRISEDAKARLATVQAIVEHHTLAIDSTNFTTTTRKIELSAGHGISRWYADQPPMMSAMLSGGYWVMRHQGLTFQQSPELVLFFLTLLGVTVPAACCAGLIYRMGRIFELTRPWRAGLAAACVLATGLISYATVLNPHVPAATFLLASTGCILHLNIARKKPIALAWLACSGACAALSAAIDPSAFPFLFLIPAAIVAMRWRPWGRAAGVLAYALGALGPILIHAALTVPVTHDFWQGTGISAATAQHRADPFHRDLDARDSTDDEDETPSTWQNTEQSVLRIASALFGDHGLLSHFPILLMGVVGGSMIMHRHWPGSAKVLASATVAGAMFVIISFSVHLKDWRQWREAMFAAQWFIVFCPLLLFWAGAWLRRTHSPAAWSLAGIVLAFSIAVSLIGATRPAPHEGFNRYTAAEALGGILHSSPEPTFTELAAGR